MSSRLRKICPTPRKIAFKAAFILATRLRLGYIDILSLARNLSYQAECGSGDEEARRSLAGPSVFQASGAISSPPLSRSRR